ncbi:hypothetical protein NE237_026777 [Protea cynaroides]|uniref:Uncharacterized protein n=1 Tax=Protea cynaroides TaxID=273540 RepID=A0A9Q0GP84_9MAGN|nr:hypothetical protein NE237_026777 [Protea cynaroides]
MYISPAQSGRRRVKKEIGTKKRVETLFHTLIRYFVFTKSLKNNQATQPQDALPPRGSIWALLPPCSEFFHYRGARSRSGQAYKSVFNSLFYDLIAVPFCNSKKKKKKERGFRFLEGLLFVRPLRACSVTEEGNEAWPRIGAIYLQK